MPTPQPQTLELVKTILRRDLKLGQNADIPDDMPFFGGDIDLDSLDILLLMTSIEKQFKIRVPSEAVGKQVFQNVTTLASYIDANGGASHEASLPVAPKPIDYLSRLPHGPEFRFITEVNQITESESGQAVWSVNGNESFLSGHFPGNPIVPGVLIVEALAQLSGLVGPDTGARSGKLAHVEVRFERPVVPPAQISLRSKFSRSMGDLQQFEVTASVNETVVASGTLALHRGTGQS